MENERKLNENNSENIKVFSSNKKQNLKSDSDLDEMHSFNEEELE